MVKFSSPSTVSITSLGLKDSPPNQQPCAIGFNQAFYSWLGLLLKSEREIKVKKDKKG